MTLMGSLSVQIALAFVVEDHRAAKKGLRGDNRSLLTSPILAQVPS